MAMGKRRARQDSLWVATGEIARGPGHPFYRQLNRILDELGFDGFVETVCAAFYAEKVGRPSLAAGGVLSAAAGGLLRGD